MTKYKQETVPKKETTQTFVIRNKVTKELWIAGSGKSSWKKAGHAKNAFANSECRNKRDPLLKDVCSELSRYESLKFDNQSIYEIVELVPEDIKAKSDSEEKLGEAKELLKHCRNFMSKCSCSSDVGFGLLYKVDEFLEG